MPPDFGAPVAQNVNVDPSKGLTTLSNLMGLQQQKQAIQSKDIGIQQQQTTLQGSEADTQAKHQTMQERLLVSKMLQSGVDDQGNSIRNAAGEPDPAKVIPALGRIAPLTGQEYAQNIIKTHSDKVGLQSASLTLDANQRKMLQGPLQALALNPSDGNLTNARNTITQLVAQHPEMAPAASHVMTLMDTVQKVQDPKQRIHMANSLSSLIQPGTAVETQPATAQVNTGTTVQQGTIAPPAAGGAFTPGSSQKLTVPPGGQEEIVTDPNTNNVNVVRRDPQGNIISARPAPGSGSPGAGPGAFTRMTPGQPGDIESARQEVSAVRSAGDQVPTVRNINSRILQLSKLADSGPGTQKWQNFLGGASALWGGTDQVNNYQELGKFLEKNAIQNMSAMGGPPSDARLSAAAAANGSTQFNAGALQAVTKFNDATTSALDKYRQGVDKAVGIRNSDYTALPTFKAAWAKNMDVDVFRVENAIRDGDQAELGKIKQELGPVRMKELAQKRRNLESLSSTGKLP